MLDSNATALTSSSFFPVSSAHVLLCIHFNFFSNWTSLVFSPSFFSFVFGSISRVVLWAGHSLPLPEAGPGFCRFLRRDIPFFRFFWDLTSHFSFFSPNIFWNRTKFPRLWSVGNPFFWVLSLHSPLIWDRTSLSGSLSDLRLRRCPISKTKKKTKKRRQAQIKWRGNGQKSVALWSDSCSARRLRG